MNRKNKILLTAGMILFGAWGNAAEIMVDFEKGNDADNGSKNAPLLTFPAALKKAEPGDVIMLLPAARPLPVSLVIHNKKGSAEKPITIDGGFNTLYGTVPLEQKSCREVAPGLYLRTRKNQGEAWELRYFMIFDGRMQRMDRNLKWRKPLFKPVEALQPGEWTIRDHNEVYFRLPAGKDWSNTAVEEPGLACGVQMSGECEYITVRNLIVRKFWNDGYNFHNRCRNIRLENIAAIGNSDDGVSAHEECQIFVKNLVSIGNGTGFCHIQNAECHHENVYIADCTGRDILLQNSRNTLKNVVVDGTALGALEFSRGENELQDCWFMGRRDGNAISWRKGTVLKTENSFYYGYAIPGTPMPGLKQTTMALLKAKIAEQKKELDSIFGKRLDLSR